MLVLGALAVLPAPAQSPEPGVAFVSPRHMATVIGPTEIKLRLDVPAGAEVGRVELLLDGKPLATLTAPPWTFSWNAGEAKRGHLLEAVLTLADGRSYRASINTTPLRIDQVEQVDLVNLYAIVLDGRDNYVSALKPTDFSILENGRPQVIERFGTERKPLRVAVVLDASLSMSRGKGAALANARRAALEFLDVLGEGDEGLVVRFNDSVQVAQELTADKALLARAIEGTTGSGGTALYDSVWRTSKKLTDFDGRRVLVLLSDGRDESADGLQLGSLHTFDEALDQALRNEVTVFAIGLGEHLHDCVFSLLPVLPGEECPGQTQGEILTRLAESTGGRALFSPSPGKLSRAYQEVAEDLRNQYSIAYVSKNTVKDGRFREIRVSVPGRDFKVITRKGYYAE